MSDLPIARIPGADAAIGRKFFYRSVGPLTVELISPWEGSGDPGQSWYWIVEPEEAGYYKASVSVRKISGDVRNVQSAAGSGGGFGTFYTVDNHASGVIPWDPDYANAPIGAGVAMNLEGSSAVVEVSAFVCSWS